MHNFLFLSLICVVKGGHAEPRTQRSCPAVTLLPIKGLGATSCLCAVLGFSASVFSAFRQIARKPVAEMRWFENEMLRR